MKIRELLEMGEMDDAMKPGGDMGGSMAANPMTPSPTASGNMGSMGQSPAPMAGTPSPGTPSPGTPSPTPPGMQGGAPGMQGGAPGMQGGAAPMKMASSWNPLSADFWTNKQPVAGAAPADPLHGRPTALGQGINNMLGVNKITNALSGNQQPPPKPNQ